MPRVASRLLVGLFECVFWRHLQSSMPNRRVTNTLLYARSTTNMSMIDSVTQMTIRPAGVRVVGSSKFGTTPAGGVKAGNRLGSYDDKSNVDWSIFTQEKKKKEKGLECTRDVPISEEERNRFKKLKRARVLASSGLELLSSALSEALWRFQAENWYCVSSSFEVPNEREECRIL